MASSGRSTLGRFFVQGIAALLPTLITLYIAYSVAVFVHDRLGAPINRAIARLPLIEEGDFPRLLGDAVGVLLILVGCMFVGFVVTSLIGRRIFAGIEGWLARLPLVRTIYPPIKQVTDFFLTRRTRPFSDVVAVEYPRRGTYSLGFVTGAGLKDVRDDDGNQMVSVFIPSSPTPMTGYVILVPASELKSLSMTVDDALRFTISAGVLAPRGEEPTRQLPAASPGGEPPPPERSKGDPA
jgi:uncharacterized membrane protein